MVNRCILDVAILNLYFNLIWIKLSICAPKHCDCQKADSSVLNIYNTESKTLKLLEIREVGTFWYQMQKSCCAEGNLCVSFFPPEPFKIKITIEISVCLFTKIKRFMLECILVKRELRLAQD